MEELLGPHCSDSPSRAVHTMLWAAAMAQRPHNLKSQIAWLEHFSPLTHQMRSTAILQCGGPAHHGGVVVVAPGTVPLEVEKFTLLQRLTQSLAQSFSFARHRGHDAGMEAALLGAVGVGLATNNAELAGVAYCRLGDLAVAMALVPSGVVRYELACHAFASVKDIPGEYYVLTTLCDVFETHQLFGKMKETIEKMTELERRMPTVASLPMPAYLRLL